MNTFSKYLICSGLLAFFASCQPQDKLFVQLGPEETGIDFINTITETDSINILENEIVLQSQHRSTFIQFCLGCKLFIYYYPLLLPNFANGCGKNKQKNKESFCHL